MQIEVIEGDYQGCSVDLYGEHRSVSVDVGENLEK